MLRRLFAAVVAVAVLAAGWALWSYAGPGPSAKDGQATDVVLPKGAHVAQIGAVLEKAGVIRSRLIFEIAAKFSGASRRLKAGEYEFKSGETVSEILSDLANGRVVRRFVSAPEGWTSQMVADAVNATPLLTGTVETPPEGSLLPDSYQYQRGDDRAALVQKMRAAHDKLLAELWASRAPDLPLKTPQEAVTLASIVEK